MLSGTHRTVAALGTALFSAFAVVVVVLPPLYRSLPGLSPRSPSLMGGLGSGQDCDALFHTRTGVSYGRLRDDGAPSYYTRCDVAKIVKECPSLESLDSCFERVVKDRYAQITAAYLDRIGRASVPEWLGLHNGELDKLFKPADRSDIPPQLLSGAVLFSMIRMPGSEATNHLRDVVGPEPTSWVSNVRVAYGRVLARPALRSLVAASDMSDRAEPLTGDTIRLEHYSKGTRDFVTVLCVGKSDALTANSISTNIWSKQVGPPETERIRRITLVHPYEQVQDYDVQYQVPTISLTGFGLLPNQKNELEVITLPRNALESKVPTTTFERGHSRLTPHRQLLDNYLSEFSRSLTNATVQLRRQATSTRKQLPL